MAAGYWQQGSSKIGSYYSSIPVLRAATKVANQAPGFSTSPFCLVLRIPLQANPQELRQIPWFAWVFGEFGDVPGVSQNDDLPFTYCRAAPGSTENDTRAP